VKAKLEDISEPWGNVDLFKILNAERERLGFSVKVFMKALRYALTGMKVGLFHTCFLFCFYIYTQIYVLYQDGPSMAAVMKVIGRETTLERLK
jgi:glutamyl-tRNA synthetase